MPRKKICFNLLLSSPGDVLEERDIIELICDDWNNSYGEEKNVIIDVRRWEKDVSIDSRERSQTLINSQLVDSCDILFAIFGKRFGTPTKNYQSGTIEEVEQVIIKGKPYFIYFMNHQYLIDELKPAQIQRVMRFKNRLKKDGSYREITGHESLKKFFLQDVTYHVNKLLIEQTDNIIIDVPSSHAEIEESKIIKENWFETSISDLINFHLEKNHQGLAVYRRGITFSENCHLWKSLIDINYPALIDCAKTARQLAFNVKYGNYEYNKDLRSIYNKWYDPIIKILSDNSTTENIKVIGVASNYGLELNEIFGDSIFKNPQIEVLDISNEAIEKGRKIYPHMNFYEGSMEENLLKNSNYDVYLNLRSIHSRGVNFQLSLSECHRILKPGGTAIISVSNGYLSPKKPGSDELFEIEGLYDNRTESFSKHRPYELARKISSKLLDYGFKNIGWVTGKTEIFIFAQK